MSPLSRQSKSTKSRISKSDSNVKKGSTRRRTRTVNSGIDSTVATRVDSAQSPKSNSKFSNPSIISNANVSSQPGWVKFSDEKLLDLRICDLELKLEDTAMVEYRDRLYAELKDRNLRVRPHCWLSDDWFSPDDVPGIAIPFYMAHRRLMRLERSQMLEVEGGTKEWCMRIMRHEAGHSIDTAFRLHRRKGYKAMFGNYSDPYPETYRPRPRSKKFVLHLEPWYAQSHPAEDFAETFAVWLKPKSRWRKEYDGWAALKKIEFVDQLMERIGGQRPKQTSRAKIDPVHRINKTLREHYAERHALYSLNAPSVFDPDLKKLFTTERPASGSKTAAAFLQKNRVDLCKTIARWTGEYRYNINQVIREMIERCRLMKLYVAGDESDIKQDLLLMMTVHTMNYLHAGHRVAL